MSDRNTNPAKVSLDKVNNETESFNHLNNSDPIKSEEPLSSLVKRVPTSPLGEELHKELADVKANGYGTIPKVDLEKYNNPQVKSVLEAIKSGNHPDRLSLTAKREKFDPVVYKKNPNKYLSISVPSRAFETAAPAEGVKRLTRVSSQYIETYQEDSVKLTVKGAEANAPVSATAFDGGHFQNGLSAITLKASDDGKATLVFTPTAGVIQDARITVASPSSSGTVHFNVYVRKNKKKK